MRLRHDIMYEVSLLPGEVQWYLLMSKSCLWIFLHRSVIVQNWRSRRGSHTRFLLTVANSSEDWKKSECMMSSAFSHLPFPPGVSSSIFRTHLSRSLVGWLLRRLLGFYLSPPHLSLLQVKPHTLNLQRWDFTRNAFLKPDLALATVS